MNKLIVTSSPHITSKRTTSGIMLDVILAMVPAIIAAYIHFGYRALLLIAVCVACCVASEALYCALLKKPVPVGDLSAVVTGILLGFNLPATLPVWQAAVGSVVSIVVVKQLFGGIGCNFVNPALAGRVIMAISFTGTMVNYAYPPQAPDLLSSATPLSIIMAGGGDQLNLWDLFAGNHGGVLGETSCLALLIGGLYLMLRGVIKPIIPVAYIGSAFVFLTLFGCEAPLASILSGGLFLGAFFMATDYTTTPYTNAGKWIFGLGCGLITAVIRIFANSTEGVSYAILLMNLIVPYINGWTRRKPYGTEAAKMSEKKAKSEFFSEMLKPVIVLTAICIVVSALLAVTNGITAPIIEQKQLEAATATRKELLPDATSFTELETTVEGIESVHVDDGGTGYVIVATGKGYKGDLPVTVALSPEGVILGIKADASGETAGVGSKVGEASYLEQYIGLSAQESDSISSATQNVDGGTQIDILSGATVSSKAVYNAVGLVFEAYEQVKGA